MNLSSLAQTRALLRSRLDSTDGATAMASYYALQAPLSQLQRLLLPPQPDRHPTSYLVVTNARRDWFYPLVILQATDSSVARWLLDHGLPDQKMTYYVTVPNRWGVSFWQHAPYFMQQIEFLQLYQLRDEDFIPSPRTDVVMMTGSNQLPRCEVRAASGEAISSAGLNWLSDRFAEMFVYTDESSRGQGYGRAVVSELAAHVLAMGRTPLYFVDTDNIPSLRLAESLGFRPTAHHEISGLITQSPIRTRPH